MRHGYLADGVGPAFEEEAIIEQGVEIGGIVETGAGQHDEVVTARDHADGIELQQADAFDDALELGLIGRRRAPVQALFVDGKAFDGISGDWDGRGHGLDFSMGFLVSPARAARARRNVLCF